MSERLDLKAKIIMSGQTQIAFAQEVGISYNRISQIIRGWVEPSEIEKVRIAHALGKSVDELFLETR